jgi:hypothetical protein
MELARYEPLSRLIRQPAIVPPESRQANDRQQFSMVRAHVPGAVHSSSDWWLNYHLYPFESMTDVLRRFPYRPAEIVLSDGRVIELMFSRERRLLPAPVVLEDFVVTAHIGGFTGQTASIRDWTSVVRFAEGGSLTDTATVSMNKPTSNHGFWFFQAQWDPPDGPRFEGDAPSRGLNYTVLGVGNRHGVYVQLLGTIIAVIGMLYAFYCKPAIKRRRQQAVHAKLAAELKIGGGGAVEGVQ